MVNLMEHILFYKHKSKKPIVNNPVLHPLWRRLTIIWEVAWDISEELRSLMQLLVITEKKFCRSYAMPNYEGTKLMRAYPKISNMFDKLLHLSNMSESIHEELE